MEKLSNENFNLAESRRIKIESPQKPFTMTLSQWCLRVNANMIDNNIPQKERLEKLNSIGRKQINLLTNNNINKISELDYKVNVSLIENK